MSLELTTEILVHVEELGRQVKLLLVEITDSSARFRSIEHIPEDAGLSFKWVGPSRTPVVVHGHVAEITMVEGRMAEYDIEFTMPDELRQQLARELIDVQLRMTAKAMDGALVPEAAAEAGEAEVPDEEDLEIATHAKRKAHRVVVQFPVSVKAKLLGRWVNLRGEARDLSMGGLLLQTTAELRDGTELELTFDLPGGGETAKSAKNESVEMTPFGERRVKKSAPAEAAPKTIQTNAKVLKNLGPTRSGGSIYGVNFVNLPAFLNEDLAKWIHAHQIRLARASSGINRRLALGGTPQSDAAENAPARATGAKDRAVYLRPSGGRLRYDHDALRQQRHLVAVSAKAAKSRFDPSGHRTHSHGHTNGDVFGLEMSTESIPSGWAPRRRRPVLADPAADVFGLGPVRKD